MCLRAFRKIKTLVFIALAFEAVKLYKPDGYDWFGDRKEGGGRRLWIRTYSSKDQTPAWLVARQDII